MRRKERHRGMKWKRGKKKKIWTRRKGQKGKNG